MCGNSARCNPAGDACKICGAMMHAMLVQITYYVMLGQWNLMRDASAKNLCAMLVQMNLMHDANAKNLCVMLVQRNIMHDANAKNLCAMVVQRNLMHDANAKNYELTDSSLDILSYRPKGLTDLSPDNLGYRLERKDA